jgi:large subunit ribosomal protein L23
MIDPRDIIMAPIETEKSYSLVALNKYSFKVRKDATKTQIKEAVEKQFKVTVDKVNTINVSGKLKRMGKFQGRRPDWKKAIVTLAPGQTIEFFERG